MNILYVLDSNTKGGMEKHVEDLVKGMVTNNHKVHVWCQKGLNNNKKDTNNTNQLQDTYKEAGAIVTANNKIKYDIDFNYIKQLKNYLIENNIDVMHSHELKASVNALIAGHLAKTKVRISHTHTPISEWQSKSLIKRLIFIPTFVFYSIIVNLFSNVEIALTQSRKKVKMNEGIKENKLKIIPNSVDVSQFDISKQTKTKYKNEIFQKYNLPSDAFVFGYVGRLTIEKGIDVLVKSFNEFISHPLNANKPFYLLLAGGGNLESYIKDLIYDYDIEDKVIITGVFEESDKIKFYSSIDLFVFPSLAEGFGIVLIEAMLCDIPVICSDLPVLNEVAGDTVTYFKTKDYIDLSQKLDDIYKKIIDKTYTSYNAKSLVIEKYSMNKFIMNYTNLYTHLLIK